VGSLLVKALKPELHPEVKEDGATGIKYLLITPSSTGVNFPSVDHISSTVQKLSLKHKTCRVIILDFSHWTTYDYTAANTLLSLVKGLKKNGKIFIFTNCSDDWVSVLKMAGLSHPPTVSGGESELSEYLRKNIQPVIALDLGPSDGKGSGMAIDQSRLGGRVILHASINPCPSEGSTCSTTSASEVTTANSCNGLV